MNPIYAIAALLAAITACSDVPDSPTWTEDVRPILVANCTRCHSPPYIGGAPPAIRFDIYNDITVVDGPDLGEEADIVVTGVVNERGTAEFVAQRTADGEMPPRYRLSDGQIETIQRWVDMDKPFGEPRPDNHLPTIELTDELVEEDNRVAVRYRIADEDFDLVTGILCATDDPDLDLAAPLLCTRLDNPQGVGSPIFIGADLASDNMGRTTWNTNGFPPGSYRLIVQLDDGQELSVVELGTVEVQP